MRSCAREETRESRECLVYSLTPSGFWAENHPKIGVSSPSDRRASCTTPLHRGPAWPPSAQLLHPTGDGLPDLVRRVFLDVMAPRDRHLGQCRQAADEGEILVVGEDRTGLNLEEQLGHIALRQPVRRGGHDLDHIGGLAIDGDLPGPGQRRPPSLAGLRERPPILRHLLGGKGAYDGPWQDLLDEEVVSQDPRWARNLYLFSDGLSETRSTCSWQADIS